MQIAKFEVGFDRWIGVSMNVNRHCGEKVGGKHTMKSATAQMRRQHIHFENCMVPPYKMGNGVCRCDLCVCVCASE